jgi:8-oxo-dGTP pyrophosphatase MutT (NUDIX family)
MILLRDSGLGPEVFLVARRAELNVFAGALVFPGGKVDPQDSWQRLIACCSQRHRYDEQQLLLRVAAIREAFEESGVLFARDQASGELLSAARMADLASYRPLLDSRELAFADFLQQQSLELAVDLLTHFSNWVTPPQRKKRFDTHFFVARVAADVQLEHCGREADDSVWATAKQLLAWSEEGRWDILFPTLANLSKVGLSATVAEVIETAEAAEVDVIMPNYIKQGDKVHVSIDEKLGFPVSEQLMPVPK